MLKLVPRPRKSTAKVRVTLHFRAFGGSKNSALKFETGDSGSSTIIGPDLVTMVAPRNGAQCFCKMTALRYTWLWEYAYLDGLTAS